jgi:hypothetical protein
MFEPDNQTELRDYWWIPPEGYYNESGNFTWNLPDVNDQTPMNLLRIKYSSLVDLYNDGRCAMTVGFAYDPVPGFVLTESQRDMFVWEILGRTCHLLADMSVPAHVHKDMHTMNVDGKVAIGDDTLYVTMMDADSYEQWVAHAGDGQIGDLTNVGWTAEEILADQSQPPFIDPSNESDPLFFLMNSMRELAASFASDEYDGTGGNGLPEVTTDIPYPHNQDWSPPSSQVAVLENIRDHTIPYCIRATAGLLYWFASNTTRVKDIYVYDEGVQSWPYFYYRDLPGDDFESYDFGEHWSKDVGDEMMLRSEYELFKASNPPGKFFSWRSARHSRAGRHQNNFLIMEGNGPFYATSNVAETSTFPTLQLSFESGLASPSEHADVLFRNPWLVDPSNSDMRNLAQLDGFLPYPATPTVQGLFEESLTNNGGMFLGAGDPEDLKPPYYSLSLPRFLERQSMDAKGWPLQAGDWFAREWLNDFYTELFSDPATDTPDPALYDTKAVIFGYAGGYITGEYKAHLMSSTPYSYYESRCMTCPNSQRKLDWVEAHYGVATDIEGLYQAVYESAYNIWYTHSTDMGMTWSPERLLQGGWHPAIASGTGNTYIAFNFDSAIELYTITQGSIPTCITSLDFPNVSDDAAPALVYDETQGIVLTVWERKDGMLKLYTDLGGGNTIALLIPGTGGSSQDAVRPSLGHKPGTDFYHLAWREGDAIFYSQIELRSDPQPFCGATPPEMVSNYWQGAYGAPSVTVDSDGNPAVAWSSSDAYNGAYISFRQRTSGGWGTMASMLSYPALAYWAPSISGISNINANEGLRIAHNIDNGQTGVLKLEYSGGQSTWTVPTLQQSQSGGMHPNVVAYTAQNFQKEVYSIPSQLYSGLTSEAAFTSEHLAKGAVTTTLASSREVALLQDTNRIRIRIGEIEVRSGNTDTALDWATGFDSLIVGTSKSVAEYFRTSSFIVPNGGQLRLRVATERVGTMQTSAPMTAMLEIVDATTHQTIATPHSIAPASLSPGHQDVNVNIPIQSLHGRNVYARFSLSGRDSTVRLVANDYYHDPSTSIPRANEDRSGAIGLPLYFTLDQNYPNPHRSRTEIPFSLREAMPVRLVVLDVLGRELAILRDGVVGAGRHVEVFDAGAVSAGMYFYKLQTPHGSQTRRMTILK